MAHTTNSIPAIFVPMHSSESLRLRLESDDVSALVQHPLLGGTPKRRRVHQTFYDTPTLALSELGIRVDETRVLRKSVLTVRQSVPEEQSWSAPTTPGTFDFSTLIDVPETAELLSQFTNTLIPIYLTDIRVRQWAVQIRSAQVEVSLEEGELITDSEDQQRTLPICELEIRLISGQAAALYGVARLLSRQVRLHPIRESFLDRAMALREHKPIEPAKAKRIRIDPKHSSIQIFKHIAWQCIEQLTANENGIYTPNCVEFIHQARVALRRLRTALRLFNTELPDGFSDKWSQAWKDVGEQLGNARNWDVFCAEMLPPIEVDLGAHPDMANLKQFAHEQRDAARENTQVWLRGRRYSLTLIAFHEALLMLPERNSTRISEFAGQALKKRYKRFCRGARVAHTLSVEARHEVRIELKKLRYTLDFFESLYSQKQLQPFLQALAETQELLGHMNDLATGEILLSLRPDHPFDLPVAWARGRMSAYIDMLPSALKPVLSAKTPW